MELSEKEQVMQTKEAKLKVKMAEAKNKIEAELKAEEERSEMETLFQQEVKKFDQEMKIAKNKVFEAMAVCENVSEKYGMPFSLRADCINAGYTPESLKTKWNKLDADFLYDYCSGLNNEWSGWTSSAVC